MEVAVVVIVFLVLLFCCCFVLLLLLLVLLFCFCFVFVFCIFLFCLFLFLFCCSFCCSFCCFVVFCFPPPLLLLAAQLLDLENTCYSGSDVSASENSFLPIQSLSKIPNSTRYVQSELIQ